MSDSSVGESNYKVELVSVVRRQNELASHAVGLFILGGLLLFGHFFYCV